MKIKKMFAVLAIVVAGFTGPLYAHECAKGIDYSDENVWAVSEVFQQVSRNLIRSEFIDGQICRHAEEFGLTDTKLAAFVNEHWALRLDIIRLAEMDYAHYPVSRWDVTANAFVWSEIALSPQNQRFLNKVISLDYLRLTHAISPNDPHVATLRPAFCSDEKRMSKALDKLLECQR